MNKNYKHELMRANKLKKKYNYFSAGFAVATLMSLILFQNGFAILFLLLATLNLVSTQSLSTKIVSLEIQQQNDTLEKYLKK